MEEKKKIGNAKLLIVAFVLTVAIIFGSTYAWLRLTKSSNTVNKITAGNLELVLDDTTSEGIKLEKAVPISDAEGEKGTEYTFTLENKGTVDLNYYLYLNDLDLAEGETRLEDNKVRYKLVKDDNVVTATNVGIYRIVFVEGNYTLDFDPQTHRFSSAVQSNGDTVTGLADHLNSQLSENATFNDGYQVVKKTFGSSNTYKIIRERNSKLISSMKKNNDNKILDKGQIDSKQKITYKLQIWIDQNAETEVMGKIFNAQLNIEATQASPQQAVAFKTGDYVKMTPTSTSYTITPAMTGYVSDQTINPSELNLWRVISINSDGTIDLVSEYTSSTKVYFQGKTGYQNYVTSLNQIASQYTNSKYTIASRHMGYNGQTGTITDTSALDSTTAPWTSDTSSSMTSSDEAKGGGDLGYQKDFDLVNKALGTVKAYKAGTTTSANYWLTSRYFYYSSSTFWDFCGWSVLTFGSLGNSRLYNYNSGGFSTVDNSHAIRPIITLKSGLTPSGSGTSENPYVLS